MTSRFQTIDPTSGQLLRTFDFADASAIEKALSLADGAFLSWKKQNFKKRADILRDIATDLEERATHYAKIMALEMGKPISEGEAEAKKCAWACRYYADNAAAFLVDEIRSAEATQSIVRKEPLGVVLAIMPWNFPFWQLFRIAAPTLMAGNVVILKHASNTPQCAIEIEQIFARANAPLGVFQSLFVAHDDIESVVADNRLKAVTLTGSNRAGISIAQAAARHLKPCVLELGGSDPFIVFDDAILETAISTAVKARCQNSGQSCIAAKRFIVHRRVLKQFTDGFVQSMQARVMGNPNDPKVNIGPQASDSQRRVLHEQVLDAKTKGAAILCGGEIPKGPGFFYPPTVITDVNKSMRLWREEVFGPVATLFAFENDDEALAIANDTPFGLGASIWSNDEKRIERFARDLETGVVFVNEMVKSDPRLPFGGVKESGYGRELGREGIMSFVNIKTIWQH